MPRRSPMRAMLKRARQRGVGLAWVAAWFLVLNGVAAPWEELGGVVSERLRWLERFVVLASPIFGATAAALAREWAPPTSARAYFRGLRRLLYPVAAVVAAALVGLELAGRDDLAGIVFGGFLGCWAGIDAAFSAWPLMAGRLIEQPTSPR